MKELRPSLKTVLALPVCGKREAQNLNSSRYTT